MKSNNVIFTTLLTSFVLVVFYILVLVTADLLFGVGDTVPDGVAKDEFISFFNRSGKSYKRVSLSDVENLESNLQLKIATFSKVEATSEGRNVLLGLVSSNFFSTIFYEWKRELNLNGPKQIILNKNHPSLLGRRYNIGEFFPLNGERYLVKNVLTNDFQGISGSGEIGWILHDGNELLYPGYEKVAKKNRPELFKFAPVQLAFSESTGRGILSNDLNQVSLQQIKYFQVTEVSAVRFGLDNYKIDFAKGIIYDREEYERNKSLAFSLSVFSMVVIFFTTIAMVLSATTRILKVSDNLKLEEILGAPPRYIVSKIVGTSAVSLLIGYFGACLVYLLLESLKNSSAILLNLSISYKPIVVTAILFLFQVIAVTVFTYSIYKSKKNVESQLRYTQSGKELVIRRVAFLAQVVMSCCVIFIFFIGFNETEKFGKDLVGFDPGGLYYLSLEPLDNPQSDLYSILVGEQHSTDGISFELAALSGPAGFGEAWQAEVGFRGFMDITSFVSFVTPNYFNLTGAKILEGHDFDPGGQPGVIINSTLASKFSREFSQLLGDEIKMTVMGVEIFKTILGVVDDERESQNVVYINNADGRGIRVEGETFLVSKMAGKISTSEVLENILDPLGWRVDRLEDVTEVIYDFRPDLKNLNFVAFWGCIVLTLLMVHTLIVSIFHQAFSLQFEFLIKKYLGALHWDLAKELAIENLYLLAIGACISIMILTFISDMVSDIFVMQSDLDSVKLIALSIAICIGVLTIVVILIGWLAIRKIMASPFKVTS